MAYYPTQYNQYPQAGYGTQNYPQFNNYQSSTATGSASTFRFSNASTNVQATSQTYSNAPFNYGYSVSSNTSTNTTTTQQQGNAYQQFSSLWYAQNSSNQTPQTQQGGINQPQANRSNQQMTQTPYTQPTNQYYSQQTSMSHQGFQQGGQQQQQHHHQQQQQQAQQQQFKGPTKSANQTAGPRPAVHNQPAPAVRKQTGASNDWSSSNQQRSTDYYGNYPQSGKPPAGWGGTYNQQQGKEWTQYPHQQNNQSKTSYQGGGGGSGDYNYSQNSSHQQPPQTYPSQPRNFQPLHVYQHAQNQRGNNPDQHRGFGERGPAPHSFGNQDNRGNWNSGPSSGQGNWNAGPQNNWGNNAGGWGDWNGPRNNVRRGGDEGRHIPPFPPAWQMMRHSQPQHPPSGGNRPEAKPGNWGGNNNWNQNWEAQGGSRQGNNNQRFSRGDGQQHNRNGRYSPNSRQTRGSNEKSNRELWSPADNKRNNKEKIVKKEIQENEKPIQANEIKAYLYAWLGMRRMRPIYDIHPVGERPDLTFRCELRVHEYKFVGVGEAVSKKDAQTEAAWNFAEFLDRRGLLKKSELPARSKESEESNEDFGTVKEYNTEKEKANRDHNRPHRNRGSRNSQKTSIPSLMSIVTAPMGNIPPFPPYDRPEPWSMPPPQRRPGPWMEGPVAPWRGGPRGGRGGWGRSHDNWRQQQRELEEQWLEEEFQHPEDIFISRMIMNQQEAVMGARRFEGRPGEWVSVGPVRSRNVSTLDDRHVIAKHAAIYPKEEELRSVHEMVTLAERALKGLSDQFVDEDHPIVKDDDDEDDEEEEEEAKKDDDNMKDDGDKKDEADDDEKSEKKNKIQILKRPKKRPRAVPDTRPRVLCAVNRVGTLAKGLLIHGDLNVSLVLLCGTIPTQRLLDRIIKHLPEKLDALNSEVRYDLQIEEAGFQLVGHLECTVTLTVTLTCTALTSQTKPPKSEENKETNEKKSEEQAMDEGKPEELKEEESKDCNKSMEEPTDMLPRPLLLAALAQLRHSKWFQARASQQDCGVVITRMIRDLKMRVPEWRPLSDWALENLVYVSLSSSTEHMSPGDALRRFFEVVAGGVLLTDRSGIVDPCERQEIDVLDCCTAQELENMTRHAQNALLKIAFRKVHEVLDMEKLSMLPNRNQSEVNSPFIIPPLVVEDDEKEGARKRRLEHNSSDSLVESPKRSLTDEEDADTQQNLAELTISDQMKGNLYPAAVEGPANDKSYASVENDVEMMETDS